jgi:molybdopterin converting factor small subunit
MVSAILKQIIMNRCTIIDRLEDEYGIKPENLTERERAIIGLCTNQFLDDEEQALRIHDVVGRSELLNAFLDYADPIYWGENECTDRRQLIDQFLKSIQ